MTLVEPYTSEEDESLKLRHHWMNFAVFTAVTAIGVILIANTDGYTLALSWIFTIVSAGAALWRPFSKKFAVQELDASEYSAVSVASSGQNFAQNHTEHTGSQEDRIEEFAYRDDDTKELAAIDDTKPPFYHKHLHWIQLANVLLWPATVFVGTLVISVLIPEPTEFTLGMTVFVIIGSILVYLMVAPPTRSKLPGAKGSTVLTTVLILAAAGGLYVWSNELLMTKLFIVASSAYWVFFRQQRWYRCVWIFEDDSIKKSLRVPWYLGDSQYEWIAMIHVDAVTPTEPAWVKFFHLNCGTLTIKTKLQDKDDVYLRNIWPLQDHWRVATFVEERIQEIGRQTRNQGVV